MENITEKRFRAFLGSFGNGSYRYENGKQIDVYTLHSCVDNNLYLSYHLTFPQKKVNFNFFLLKAGWGIPESNVTVSFWNGKDELHEKDRLRNTLKTKSMAKFESYVNEIFVTWND